MLVVRGILLGVVLVGIHSISAAETITVAATGSVEQLCSNLQPGEWGEVVGHSGLAAAVTAPGSSGHIFTYGNHGVWDDSAGVGYFSGGDHMSFTPGGSFFVKFDAQTQAWTRIAEVEPGHARCDNWFDPDTRRYGYRLQYRNLPDEKTLHSIPEPPNRNTGWGNNAYVFIRGQGLVDIQGEVPRGRVLPNVVNAQQSDWRELDFSGVRIDTDFFAVYSSKFNGAYFGGGALQCMNTFYFLDSTLTVRELPPFPGDSCLSVAPGDQSFWSDPGTGDLMVLQDSTPVQLWAFNLETAQWRRLPDMGDFAYHTNNEHLVMPINSRNCAVVAEFDKDGQERMWVHKHGASGPGPKAPTAVSVQ